MQRLEKNITKRSIAFSAILVLIGCMSFGAVKYQKTRLDSGSTLFYQAFNSYLNGQIDVSLEELHRAAKLGDSNAQAFLARIYHDGFFIAQDLNRALKFAQSAANQGHIEGLFILNSAKYGLGQTTGSQYWKTLKQIAATAPFHPLAIYQNSIILARQASSAKDDQNFHRLTKSALQELEKIDAAYGYWEGASLTKFMANYPFFRELLNESPTLKSQEIQNLLEETEEQVFSILPELSSFLAISATKKLGSEEKALNEVIYWSLLYSDQNISSLLPLQDLISNLLATIPEVAATDPKPIYLKQRQALDNKLKRAAKDDKQFIEFSQICDLPSTGDYILCIRRAVSDHHLCTRPVVFRKRNSLEYFAYVFDPRQVKNKAAYLACRAAILNSSGKPDLAILNRMDNDFGDR